MSRAFTPRTPDETPTTRRRRERPRPGGRDRRRRGSRVALVVVGVLAAVALGAIAVAVVMAGQAQDARAHLVAARSAAEGVADAVRAQDPDRVRTLADEASRHVHQAQDIVEGPLWQAASPLPVVGPNVAAVRTMTRAAVVVDERALPAGLRIMTDLSSGALSTDGAGVALEPLRSAQEDLPAITAAVGEADEMLTSIDTTTVVPDLAAAASGFRTLLGDLRPALDDAQRTLPVLLGMVGGEGPRSYLVVFQNSAETRATGGNPSAMTVLDVDDGRAAIDTQADSTTFYNAGLVGTDVTDVPAQTRALYEGDTWQFPQNYTRTPDFPLTAHLFDVLWTRATGQRIDGVISLDPTALSRVLAVTGPVALDDGEVISAENAVPLLLKDAYDRYGDDGAAADAFFARVVQSVFGVLARGDWAPVPMIDALSQGVREHRVLAWMRDAQAQSAVVDAGMAGTFSADGDDLGIFVNDSSHSKLEYYLSSAVDVVCDPGQATARASITLTSTAPEGGLSGYVQGHRNPSMGLPGSTMLLDVLAFAPAGARLQSVDPASGDVPRWDRAGADAGRDARSITVELAAGQTRTVSFTSTYDPAVGIHDVRFTPGIGDTPVTLDDSCR